MVTTRHSQTIAPQGLGTLRLRGSVVSPYFQSTTTRKMGHPRRDINSSLATMLLKAFVMGYTPNTAAINIDLQSDDLTIQALVSIPLAVGFSDTDASIRSSIETTVSNYCTGVFGIRAPDFFVWDFVTPTDLLAAIPPAPSSYQTIVSQTGTAAPAVSGSLAPVSTYPVGTTFTWARTGAGVYTLTASTAVFNTSGKTGVFIAPLQNLNASVRGVVTSSTVITFTTAVQSVAILGLLGLTTTNTDALLNQTMVYVQTY